MANQPTALDVRPIAIPWDWDGSRFTYASDENYAVALTTAESIPNTIADSMVEYNMLQLEITRANAALMEMEAELSLLAGLPDSDGHIAEARAQVAQGRAQLDMAKSVLSSMRIAGGKSEANRAAAASQVRTLVASVQLGIIEAREAEKLAISHVDEQQDLTVFYGTKAQQAKQQASSGGSWFATRFTVPLVGVSTSMASIFAPFAFLAAPFNVVGSTISYTWEYLGKQIAPFGDFVTTTVPNFFTDVVPNFITTTLPSVVPVQKITTAASMVGDALQGIVSFDPSRVVYNVTQAGKAVIRNITGADNRTIDAAAASVMGGVTQTGTSLVEGVKQLPQSVGNWFTSTYQWLTGATPVVAAKAAEQHAAAKKPETPQEQQASILNSLDISKLPKLAYEAVASFLAPSATPVVAEAKTRSIAA